MSVSLFRPSNRHSCNDLPRVGAPAPAPGTLKPRLWRMNPVAPGGERREGGRGGQGDDPLLSNPQGREQAGLVDKHVGAFNQFGF